MEKKARFLADFRKKSSDVTNRSHSDLLIIIKG
jgi:hypothetical protein